MSAATATCPTTVKTYLKPIDRDGLMAFAEKGRNNPATRGTNKVHSVMQGMYRSLSYVGDHQPVVVDEPLHLFGEDTAPAPGEIVLSGLGGCLAVGITAVATWKQVKLSKLEIFLEGDIGNPAAWGAGGAEMAPEQMGFQAIRVKVLVEAGANIEAASKVSRIPTPLARPSPPGQGPRGGVAHRARADLDAVPRASSLAGRQDAPA